MRNQVAFLNKKGIRTATINSNHSKNPTENEKINRKILEEAMKRKYKAFFHSKRC